MHLEADQLERTAEAAAGPGLTVQRAVRSRERVRKSLDRFATGFVTIGGITVIASILGLLVLFLTVIAPLWRNARVEVVSQSAAQEFTGVESGRILAIGCEEYRRAGLVITDKGLVQFFNLPDFKPIARSQIPLATRNSLSSVSISDDGFVAAASSAGEVNLGKISYQLSNSAQRDHAAEFSLVATIRLDTTGKALRALSFAGSPEEGMVIAGITEEGAVVFYSRQVATSLFGEGEVTESVARIKEFPATPSAVVVEKSLAKAYLGLDNGALLEYDLADPAAPQLTETMRASSSGIASLGFLIGDRSLVVGDTKGRVDVWFASFDESDKGPRKLRRAHTLTGHPARVTAIAPSERNRTFFTGSAAGDMILHFSTNERVLHRQRFSEAALTHMFFAPKGDAALIVDSRQNVSLLAIDNPHPEANWKAFFGKIWYEGYGKPEYVWQSSSGTDDFEAKLSLMPLIFGTLKGTVYALLFALPVGVLSALYVSQFMHANLRGMVKPTMEIMAALPSVVLGFFAGLWLAPRVQPIVPSLFAMILLVPSVALLVGYFWQKVPKRLTQKLHAGAEIFVLLPFVILAGWICINLNGTIESIFFGGDFRQWLLSTFNVTYDQRNAFVVGIVMGFAVIPIIFTISEDALSNVPQSLVAASLALGATQWQTALRVVLPTASPGIFSATMIGLGRAVGETMIVLMATGNTPVMDWSAFNGFRTLSANIAVEIPEAPADGTLFRALFLAAFILFIMTFVVNTVAEFIRQNMRAKYGK